MTSKVYRSANGKLVDIGALLITNENTRSVGNMGVNANGDRINSNNEIILTKNEQVQSQYNRTSSKTLAAEGPIPTSRYETAVVPDNQGKATQKINEKKVRVKSIEEQFTDTLPVSALPLKGKWKDRLNLANSSTSTSSTAKEIPAGGLAAAIARSKEIKQESIKTARQLAQLSQGVKKI